MNIDVDVFEKMLKVSDDELKASVMFNVNRLFDYSDFVSKLDDTIKKYSDSDFMIKKLDSDRREKHDMAIMCIYDLNKISNALGLGDFYTAQIDDESRDVIAQSIYEFSKYYLNFK